jgi:hypothetical protein
MTWDDDEWMVRMRLWIGFREDYLYTIFDATSHALRMQTTAKLGSLDPFISYCPLKLIGVDHGLHTSGGVQIS